MHTDSHGVYSCASCSLRGFRAVPVRHRGEPGHTRRHGTHTGHTRDTLAHKGTRTTQTNLTTIQTHQQHTSRTSARRPKPRPTQQPQARARSPSRVPRPRGISLEPHCTASRATKAGSMCGGIIVSRTRGVPSALTVLASSDKTLSLRRRTSTYNDARYVCIRPFLLSSYYVLVQSLSLSKLCRTSRASRFTSRTAE